MSRKLRVIVSNDGTWQLAEYVCDHVTTNKYLTKLWNYDKDGHLVEEGHSFQPTVTLEIRANG